MKSMYMAPILQESLEVCRGEINNVIENIKNSQDLSFYLSIVLIIMLLIMTMFEAIRKFSNLIMETKKLISILPTTITSFQIIKLKKAIQALS